MVAKQRAWLQFSNPSNNSIFILPVGKHLLFLYLSFIDCLPAVLTTHNQVWNLQVQKLIKNLK